MENGFTFGTTLIDLYNNEELGEDDVGDLGQALDTLRDIATLTNDENLKRVFTDLNAEFKKVTKAIQ